MNDIEAGFYGTHYEGNTSLPLERVWYRSTRGGWWILKGPEIDSRGHPVDAIAVSSNVNGAMTAARLPWDRCIAFGRNRELVSTLDRLGLVSINEGVKLGPVKFTHERVGEPKLEMNAEGVDLDVDDDPDMVRYERVRTTRMYVVRVRGSSQPWEEVPTIEARDSRDAAERWASSIDDADQIKCEHELEVLPQSLLGHIKLFRVYSRPNWIHTASRIETGVMKAEVAKPWMKAAKP